MRQLLVVAATLSLECTAHQPRAPSASPSPPTLPIWVTSHNRSDVDVYLLCGEQDAEWLGVLQSKDTKAFAVPASRARCAVGLNFFLVPRRQKQGYWVGPLYPTPGSSISLTIERYAGLSTVGTFID